MMDITFENSMTEQRRDTQQARRFVADLRLAAQKTRRRFDTTQPAANVDAGSLSSFLAGLNLQQQEDVLNSTLLAQLAANAQFDREKDTVNWYGFYKTVLENVGWQISAFNFSQFQANTGAFTAEKVILELLAAIATPGEILVAKATLDAVKSLADSDQRVVVFESQSHSDTNGNFQILVASNDNGDVAMKIGAFYFNTTDKVTRLLFFSFPSSSTNFYQGSQVMNLDEDVYSTVRQSIIDKLGDNAVKFVFSLPLKAS